MDEEERKLREEIDQLLEEERVIREKRQSKQHRLWHITMEAFLKTL